MSDVKLQMPENALYEGLKTHFGPAQIKQLASVHVGIAGAGGLGSNVAVHLVRSGIRRLTIADFDRVEASNLNRQFYFQDQLGLPKVRALQANLSRINPDIDVEAVDMRLDAANVHTVFAHCRVIVEALDQASAKKMMADCFMSDPRLLVCASGVGGWGDCDRIRVRRLRDRFCIVGDGHTETSASVPPTSAIVGIAAAKQADLVIEAVLGTNATTPLK